MAHKKESGRFEPISAAIHADGKQTATEISGLEPSARSVVRDLVRNKVPFVSRAGWLTTAHGASAGYLLNRLVSRIYDREVRANTLYTNSDIEAIYAFARIARHRGATSRGIDGGSIIIFDPDDAYRDFFDPCRVGSASALCQDIAFARTPDECQRQMSRADLVAIVFCLPPAGTEWAGALSGIVARAEARQIATAIVDADRRGGQMIASGGNLLPDALIFGSNLTGHQVPFGCIVLQSDVYEVWNSQAGLQAYGSTWAGNTVALQCVINEVSAQLPLSDDDRGVLRSIEQNYKTRVRYFNEYVHPPMSESLKRLGLKADFAEVDRFSFELRSGQNILDVSGMGCSLRGYHHPDTLAALEADDDLSKDHHALLEGELFQLTGLDKLLPAVSGATAVDAAITAGLLARAPRTKIVTFRGNYSGKSLISVNFSRHPPLTFADPAGGIAPYYRDVTYIDPWQDGADQELATLLNSGDVALVWFEPVQGFMCRRLPESILRTVFENKESGGYLVGVDEVLTGMWRTPDRMLDTMDHLDKIDAVSMSKGTSDMTFPTAWTLLRGEVFEKALLRNPRHMHALGHRHRNQLAMQIGRGSVRAGVDFQQRGNGPQDLAQFVRQFEEVLCESPIFSGLRHEGSLIKIVLNPEWFPYGDDDFETVLVEGVLSRLILEYCDVLVVNLRIFLPCLLDKNFNVSLKERFAAGLRAIHVPMIYEELGRTLGAALPHTAIGRFMETRDLAAGGPVDAS